MGYGAVKYADLKNHRMTNYKFSFDNMLSLQVGVGLGARDRGLGFRSKGCWSEGSVSEGFGSIPFPRDGAKGGNFAWSCAEVVAAVL